MVVNLPAYNSPWLYTWSGDGRCGGGRPAKAHHSVAQHLLETRVHFLFFDELVTVGLCDTFTHGGAEAAFFLKQPHDRIFHQPFGVGP